MPMQLDLVSTKPPNLQITPEMANLTITGTMGADVIKPDKTIVNAFVLGVVSWQCYSIHVPIHNYMCMTYYAT